MKRVAGIFLAALLLAAGNHREVCIDKLKFDDNGKIIRVVPTLDGVTEPVNIK